MRVDRFQLVSSPLLRSASIWLVLLISSWHPGVPTFRESGLVEATRPDMPCTPIVTCVLFALIGGA